MNIKTTHPRALALAALMLTLTILPAVDANHLRSLIGHQSGVNGNEVTIQFDFNPSGDCCGGGIFFNIGEPGLPVTGYFPDGIVNGAYTNDQPWTSEPLNNGGGRNFEWRRFEVVTAPQLIRMELKYTYLNAGTYLFTWTNCCPQSDATIIVSTSPQTQMTILSLETGHNYAWQSLEVAGFFECGSGNTDAICYDRVPAAEFGLMTLSDLSAYDTLYVGSKMDSAAQTVLAAQATNIDTFIQNGGGAVVYTQDNSIGAAGYTWLPGGTSYAATVEHADDVELTIRGKAHMTYMNQFDVTVSNWGFARDLYFTSWPAFMDGSTAIPALGTFTGPLATGATLSGNQNKVVSLASDYGSGCIFVTGQPVDAQANGSLGNPSQSAAQQMVRTTIEYGLRCTELATSQIIQ